MNPNFIRWFASPTIWGGIVGIISGIMMLCGVTVTYEQQQQVVDGLVSVAQFIAGMSACVSGLVVIWGRITTYRPIDTTGNRAISADPCDCRILPCKTLDKPEFIAKVEKHTAKITGAGSNLGGSRKSMK